MGADPKVYEYRKEAVQDAIVGALKRRRGEATVADLVAFTGLPSHQVETELPAVADEYSGRLKVTESGDILYSFPRGFTSRYRGFGPFARRTFKGLKKGVAAAAAFLFKAWIMVMLIGYFALFVILILVALAASMAANASDRDGKSRGRSGGGLALTGRLIDLFVRIWFYNEVFKGPGQRRYEHDRRTRAKENRRPLHKAIFSFVLGEPDPNAGHDALEKRAFVALARRKKGVVLLEDFMSLTGLSPADADLAINRYLYEFGGSPEVSEAGTVYYRFPSLLRRARADEAGADESPFKRLRPFSANDKKANAWYAGINGFNLVLGGYFLYFALAHGFISGPAASGAGYLYYVTLRLLYQFMGEASLNIVVLGLGVVPLAFSALFWLVPLVRAARLAKENEAIKAGNLRRVAYAQALAKPANVAAPDPAALPEAARPASGKRAAEKAIEELAAYEGGDPTPSGAWAMPALERKLKDLDGLRAKVRPEDYTLGSVAFDTDAPGDS